MCGKTWRNIWKRNGEKVEESSKKLFEKTER